MRRILMTATVLVTLLALSSAAYGQAAAPAHEGAAAPAASPIPLVGACIAAALAVLGGAMGIGRIAAGTVAAISRQPEAAGQMFLAWLLPAAMIEGVTLFGIVLCLLVITR
jgi:F-type H+-transporting ATPase subunit c